MIFRMDCWGRASFGFWPPGGTSSNGTFLMKGTVLLSYTSVLLNQQVGVHRRILPCSRRVLCHCSGNPKPKQLLCQPMTIRTCALRRLLFRSRLPLFCTVPSSWRSAFNGIWVSIEGSPWLFWTVMMRRALFGLCLGVQYRTAKPFSLLWVLCLGSSSMLGLFDTNVQIRLFVH